MGWFDEQIKQRINSDNEAFSDAFASMAGAVMGRSIMDALMNDRQKTKNAVDEILKYYHVRLVDLPDDLTDLNEQLEYLLRPSGIMRRVVNLDGDWYKDAVGAFLGKLKTGDVVALIPSGLSGYVFYDYKSGKKIKLNRKTAALLEKEAICFYKPLPLKKLGIRDLLFYIVRTLSPADFLLVGLAALAVTLVGMLGPKINNIIFSKVIGSSNMNLFFAVTVMLVAAGIANLFLSSVSSMVMGRFNIKTSVAVQAASMMRVLSLPAEFLKNTIPVR